MAFTPYPLSHQRTGVPTPHTNNMLEGVRLRGLLHQVVLEVLRRVVEDVPVRVVGLPQVVEVVVQALLQVVPVGVGSLVLVEQRCQSSSRGSSSSLVLLVVLGLLVQVVLEVVPLSVLLVLLLRLVVEAVLNRVVELREVVEVVVQVFLLVVPVAGNWVPLLLFALRWWSSSGPPPLGRSPRGTLRPPRTACSIGKGLGELRRLSSAASVLAVSLVACLVPRRGR